MATEYYRNGKLDPDFAAPHLYMYRDGERVPVPLGRTAKSYLDRTGRPQNNPSERGGVGLMREVLTDFVGQQVWDEAGNNIPVSLYNVDGRTCAFVVAERDATYVSADLYFGFVVGK